jgi:hypothetical protein
MAHSLQHVKRVLRSSLSRSASVPVTNRDKRTNPAGGTRSRSHRRNVPIQHKSVLRRLLRDAICGLERRFGPGARFYSVAQAVCFRLLQVDEWILRLERACRPKEAVRRR